MRPRPNRKPRSWLARARAVPPFGAAMYNMPIGALITGIGARAGRPIVDKTGLTGHYDFNVTYEPIPVGPGFNPIGAAIFVPIQDLGLRVESQKDAVEVLVIDSIERPSAN